MLLLFAPARGGLLGGTIDRMTLGAPALVGANDHVGVSSLDCERDSTEENSTIPRKARCSGRAEALLRAKNVVPPQTMRPVGARAKLITMYRIMFV